jgi:hypothetical protein
LSKLLARERELANQEQNILEWHAMPSMPKVLYVAGTHGNATINTNSRTIETATALIFEHLASLKLS